MLCRNCINVCTLIFVVCVEIRVSIVRSVIKQRKNSKDVVTCANGAKQYRAIPTGYEFLYAYGVIVCDPLVHTIIGK